MLPAILERGRIRVIGSAIGMVLVLATCTGAETMRPEDITGKWARTTDALPPVNLTLTDSGGGLRARLRLSGSDLRGSARLEGKRLRLVFEGRPGEIVGEFVSATELELQFSGVATPFTLRRTER